ncbi:unnamed protein product [Protopolystoma xenopodis]|uniref:Uncharacterized protein n=1 Tax=Protopolystoma xenopodis TaxID=117903 RepID=A0A3S5AP76_9PLAT|nr:unnamed protein product [Protopolystoma xenopodis]
MWGRSADLPRRDCEHKTTWKVLRVQICELAEHMTSTGDSIDWSSYEDFISKRKIEESIENYKTNNVLNGRNECRKVSMNYLCLLDRLKEREKEPLNMRKLKVSGEEMQRSIPPEDILVDSVSDVTSFDSGEKVLSFRLSCDEHQSKVSYLQPN